MKNETALLNRITNMGFLCAILVILIHCEVPMVAQGFAWEIVRFFQGGITGIAVPFFFLVSGYFLGRHQVECGEYRTEVQKRLWTLVLPFYAWNVLYWAFVVLMIAAFAMMRGEPAAEHLAYFLRAKTFAYLSGFGADVFLEPLWYVRTLFLLVLLSPVLVRLNRKPLWLIAPAAAVLAYLTIRPDLPCVPVTPRYLIRYTFSPTGLLYFSIGLFLSRRPIRHRFPRCLYVIALFVGAAILLFRLSVVHSDGWNLALLEIANPFVMFGLWGFVPSVALPKFLSGLTFPLFVLHEFSIAFVGRVFKRMAIWEIDDLSGYLVFVAIVVGGTILLALGLKRLFPRAMAVLCGGRR